MDPSSQVGFTSPSSHFGLPWDRLHGGPVIYLIVDFCRDSCQDSCQDCCQDCCPGPSCTVGLWYIFFPRVLSFDLDIMFIMWFFAFYSMRWETWSPKLFRFRGDPSPQTGCFAGDEPLQHDIWFLQLDICSWFHTSAHIQLNFANKKFSLMACHVQSWSDQNSWSPAHRLTLILAGARSFWLASISTHLGHG